MSLQSSSLSLTVSVMIGLVFLGCNQIKAPESAGQRPNVLFLLADDLGWNEVGFNGERPHTPHIDALSRESTQLSQFYVHAVCAPSRAAFLTGKYPFRTWSDWRSEDFGKPTYLKMLGLDMATNRDGEQSRMLHGVPSAEVTIAEALQANDYYTAIMGKWHCGEWLPEHLPMGQGFDHQYGHYAWGIDYTNFTIPHNAPARFAVYDWHRNQQPIAEEGYSTDLIANEVVNMLALHKEKHGDQPFFYYVPFNAIHGPFEQIPRYVPELGKRYAALKCMDDAVGNILGALDQHGFSDNTLVVFTNDNGAIRDTMNAPLRGTKNTNYEGGVRVPCLLRWPGKLPSQTSREGMMHITDFYPTLLSLVGAELPDDLDLDGIDLSQMIIDGHSSPRDEIVFDVAGCVRPPAIRVEDFKLIGDELYNIADDPFEEQDLASSDPARVQHMKERVAAVGRERPPMPDLSRVMTPALPWVYGQEEHAHAPQWLKERMRKIRTGQPQEWPEGVTPWPKAPVDGKIEYTGDGR